MKIFNKTFFMLKEKIVNNLLFVEFTPIIDHEANEQFEGSSSSQYNTYLFTHHLLLMTASVIIYRLPCKGSWSVLYSVSSFSFALFVSSEGKL